MKRFVLYLFLSIGGVESIFCQNFPDAQTPCTTASQGKAGNFVINYTIGEMVLVQSWKANGLYITQGVLQPFTFLNDNSYECFSRTEVQVYPNPNPGVFSLQLSILNAGNVKTNLFDASGKLLQKDDFPYSTFMSKQYSIRNLSNGIYYLQLLFTETGSGKPKACVYTIQKSN